MVINFANRATPNVLGYNIATWPTNDGSLHFVGILATPEGVTPPRLC